MREKNVPITRSVHWGMTLEQVAVSAKNTKEVRTESLYRGGYPNRGNVDKLVLYETDEIFNNNVEILYYFDNNKLILVTYTFDNLNEFEVVDIFKSINAALEKKYKTDTKSSDNKRTMYYFDDNTNIALLAYYNRGRVHLEYAESNWNKQDEKLRMNETRQRRQEFEKRRNQNLSRF